MLKVGNCEVEIDEDRNVIYVHSDQGATLIRLNVTALDTVNLLRSVRYPGTNMLDINTRKH